MESYVFESFFAKTTITILDIENAPRKSRIVKLDDREGWFGGGVAFKMHGQTFCTTPSMDSYSFFMRNLNKPCMLLQLQKEGCNED